MTRFFQQRSTSQGIGAFPSTQFCEDEEKHSPPCAWHIDSEKPKIASLDLQCSLPSELKFKVSLRANYASKNPEEKDGCEKSILTFDIAGDIAS
jgi:hypothetical protein